MPEATLQFLGGAGTVTGSKYLVAAGGRQILLDCGMFQGLKELRLRNWDKPPFDPARIEAVVLSHAHIDHSGYLPLVVRRGFKGPVYCTPGTADLLGIVLPDAGRIQEEEAESCNRHGYSKHKPALPLFTEADADAACRLVQPRPYERLFPVTAGIGAILRPAGHILGSASIELQIGPGEPYLLVFSGDLGRGHRALLPDPAPVPRADTLLLESTYGDRVHPADPTDELARVVNDAVKRGGALLIPAFAVDRTQEVLWILRQLEDAKRIPTLPVYVDSPMAVDVTQIYARHSADQPPHVAGRVRQQPESLSPHVLHLARTQDQSKAINHLQGPVIIISASGMAEGGRVLHHLKHRLDDPKTTVLLVGYQAEGTRGRSLQDGARAIRLLGQEVPVRAHVETLGGLSGHADREEILRWLSGFQEPPRQTYLVHGEPAAAEHLADAVRRLGWNVRVARRDETVVLDGPRGESE